MGLRGPFGVSGLNLMWQFASLCPPNCALALAPNLIFESCLWKWDLLVMLSGSFSLIWGFTSDSVGQSSKKGNLTANGACSSENIPQSLPDASRRRMRTFNIWFPLPPPSPTLPFRKQVEPRLCPYCLLPGGSLAPEAEKCWGRRTVS